MSMGNATHYHGVGEQRYGHSHPFLHVVHEHDEAGESANRVAGALLRAIGMTETDHDPEVTP